MQISEFTTSRPKQEEVIETENTNEQPDNNEVE